MKTSALLSSLALTATALADPVLFEPPTKVERDLATVTSVMAQVSGAISQLDKSVQGFNTDASQVTSDTTKLINALQSGTTAVKGSSALALQDALGLQPVVTGLQSTAQGLISDLSAKKSNFEKAGLCDTVSKSVAQIGTDSQALIDAVVSKVPQEARGIAANLAGGLTNTLNQGKAIFAPGNCTNAAGSGGATTSTGGGGATASASASASRGGGAGGATVTVTATGACGGGGGAVPTSSRAASSSARVNATSSRTASATASRSSSPVVTAAAVANAVGPAGVLLGLFAFLL